MDFAQIIGSLYSKNQENVQCSHEQTKHKWKNMINLLNSIESSSAKYLPNQGQSTSTQSEIKNNLLKNSTLQLFCQSQEQLEYLVNLQAKFQERGLQLKDDLNEQQMTEVGICFAIILILEKDLNSSFFNLNQNQTEPTFKSIHKVLNYDYFIENGSNENLQRYEEIANNPAYSQIKTQDAKIENQKNNELDKYLKTELKHTSSSPQLQSQSPLKIQIQNQHQKTFSTQNFFSQNLYKNSQMKKNSAFSEINNNNLLNQEKNQNVMLRESHILNLSILFYRFYQSFQMSYETFSQQYDYSLSNQFQNLICQQQANFSFQDKVLKESQQKAESNLFSQQKYITPKRLTTPNAIRLIENNQSIISENKENQQGNILESNLYSNSFEKSVINQNLDILNYFFDDPSRKHKIRSNRHSLDCTADRHNDSPKQLKKFHMSKKKEQRFDSCVMNGNNKLFEESQLIINKLDLQKRRYQQYSQEQSKQIQELHSLYIQLKNKYDILQQSTFNFQIAQDDKYKTIQGRLSFSGENQSKKNQQEIPILGNKNCGINNRIVNVNEKQSLKNEDQIFESKVIQSSTLCQSNVKTSECNPMIMQHIPSSNMFFMENDSDINRRQIHDEILSQNLLFQSVELNQSDNNGIATQQNTLNLEDWQQIPFNYVSISDISNFNLRSSNQIMKNRNRNQAKKKTYSKKDFAAMICIIGVFVFYFLLLFYF